MKKILLGLIVVLGLLVAINAESVKAVSYTEVSQAGQEKTHWITTSSGVRHNSSCRYFKNSKGRMCTPDEGRACKICGG
jgi:hypothetical protein